MKERAVRRTRKGGRMEEKQGRVIGKQVGTKHAGEMKEGEVSTTA
jgi:hypothetical protein